MPGEQPAQVQPLIGGGKIGQHVRDTDWAATPLGDYAGWPQSLRSALSLVLNSKGVAALCWGPQQWLLYNDAYSAALGDRHPWAFGRPMPEVLTDLAPMLGPQVAEVLATGRGFAIENLAMVMRRHGRDEPTIWTYNFSPIQGEGTGFAGVLLLATEMTQQKLADRAEQQVRTRLTTALQVAKLGAFDWCHAAGTVEVDARSRVIFGLPLHGAIREEDIFGRIAPKDRDRVQSEATMYARLEAPSEGLDPGRTVEFSYDVVHPDGSLHSVESNGQVVQAPDGTYRVVGTFNDVTDLRCAQKVLQEQKASLEQQVAQRTIERDLLFGIFETTDVMIMACGLDYTILAINKANADEFERIYGVRPKVGDNMLDLLDDQPEHQAQVREGWGQGLTGGEITIIEDYGDPARARPDYEVRFRPLWNERGERIGCYQFVTDVTERLRDQAKLAQMQEALRQSQKMEAVGQLTGGLAHDFNNLLTGISGSLEILSARVAQGRTKDLERFIAAAEGAAGRAAALTHRLLAFSRRQTLAPQPTDVNRLMAGMEELIRRTVGPSVVLEVVGPEGLWPTLIDPNQLENALLNLSINARDAMPEGGRLTIETANMWLDERAAGERDLAAGPYISLCVTDTGTGMTPEVVERAFDPFFTTKPLGQGTGLGLSMIHGFVRQSGGQVHIHSRLGQGSTMCLYLPRHLGAADATEKVPVPTQVPRAEAGQTVLVVDDEPTVRMLILEVLEELGYAGLEAEDGAAGLHILRSDARIDLLVSDVGLPGGMNGRQMADAARALRPTLKVLFITGYAENAVLSHGHLEPGMRVLTKPFALEALASRIKELTSDR
ncbi:ATP-binding protein [Pseudoroseomonas globiformis]|uniref:histidine kinase n=1 Tax=Teichococcus globiformis TaxID=2307229 RepID=A0ABV7FT01_9PROT